MTAERGGWAHKVELARLVAQNSADCSINGLNISKTIGIGAIIRPVFLSGFEKGSGLEQIEGFPVGSKPVLFHSALPVPGRSFTQSLVWSNHFFPNKIPRPAHSNNSAMAAFIIKVHTLISRIAKANILFF
ncbi:MAG: hypothetical protein IPJ82_13355 [Lewinellaceae bacterium]|nr:hypothetical protein [Lewinellaceae bacterium]